MIELTTGELILFIFAGMCLGSAACTLVWAIYDSGKKDAENSKHN